MFDILKSINNFINEQLNSFTFDNNTLDKMEKIYTNNLKYNKQTLKIIINDNKLKFIYPEFTGNRIQNYVDLFNDTLKYIKPLNKKFKDCVIYLYIIDSYNFEHQDMPFFIIARPENKKGILIPDNTFKCHTIEKKCLNWEETNDVIDLNCQLPTDQKKKKIFFKGANTGSDKHNLRKMLENESTNKQNYSITIGSHQIPLYKFCQYKYLLNIPGHQPWSYRFKYLFLMKGLVMNIDLRQHYGDIENGRWINFFDVIFEDRKDYINLVYHWHEGKNKKNKKNYNKLVKKIDSTYEYYENNPDEYDKMVMNGYNKVSMINQNLIYETIYLTVNAYADKLNN
jgi:hypothetical protein